jgi:hypothetical protein
MNVNRLDHLVLTVPRGRSGYGLCHARTFAMFPSWCFCAPQAALRYSLIRPWTTGYA